MPTHAMDLKSNGGRLVSVDGKDLPLRCVLLEGEAAGGLARATLRQSFHNSWAQPLKVTYTVPLPADGAVSSYTMKVGDRVVHGEIERRRRARERFDEAMLEGRTASLLEQERGSVFTLQLGNVPAGTDVDVELVVDQRLAWLPDGEWEWRFPTVVAPRYLGAGGRVPDADNVTVDVADGPTGVPATLRMTIGDTLAATARPESPSHSICHDGATVTLEGEQACLDRDIVLRWRVAAAHPGLALRRARPGAGRPHAGHAYGLLTIVPPSAAEESLPRDLILLIDTSGSMSGFPLESAKKVVGALVESLSEQDRLEMISFALEPQRWKLEPVAAGEQARREARLWLEGLQAGGGTEMASGLREALRPLRPEAQRQVVLVTDGLIGFESEVVAMLRDRLPRGARLHVVGIGAAVNRSLTGPAARAGRGAEVIIGPDEPAGRAAERIVAATRRPILVNLIVEGDAVAGHVPKSLPDVMSGSPCLAGVRLRPEGGDLIVSAQGPSGAWRESLRVPPTDPEEGSDAIVKLYGREAVEDLELDLAAGGDAGEIDRAVERLGLQFGIATRLTSWVAVSEEKSVDPSEPVRATRIPQEIPYGMSAEGLGLREASWFGGDMLIRGAFLGKIDRRSPMRVGRAKPDLVGSWLSPREDGLIVLEVTIVEGTISWKPQGLVRLLKMDGPPDRHGGLTSTEAAIEPGLSTREGVLTMGQLFRVALRADRAVVEQVFLVVLDLEGESLRVRVK